MDRSEIVFFAAASREKLEKSSRLVYKEYLKEGYVDEMENPCELPIFRFNLLPTSVTFQAEAGENVIATVSLIAKGALGVPMEAIYKEELEKLENKNKKIAEISQLAMNREWMESMGRNKMRAQSLVLLSLFRLVFYCANYRGISALCIAVNPKHEEFYDSLGFQNIGPLKYYSSVNSAPALAKTFLMDKKNLKNNQNNLILREILNNPLKREVFEGNKDRVIFAINL